MKKLIALLLALAMACSISGCAAPGGDKSTQTLSGVDTVGTASQPQEINYGSYDESATAEAFLQAVNSFGYRTAPGVLEQGMENFCYSPLSLYYALAMVTAGADGETARQLLDVLGTDQETLASQCKELYRWLYREGKEEEDSAFLIANSLWMDSQVNGEEITYREEFIDNAVENYYASLFSADFSDPKTGEAIAKWIEENTKGLLSYQPEVNSQMMMAVINTIYFKDQWADQFEASRTEPDTFTKADGSEITCDFMRQTLDNRYYRGDNYLAAVLPLRHGGGMTFILPDEGTDAWALLQDEGLLEEALSGEHVYGEVVWSVPKFTFDTELAPIEALEALGVTDAFAGGIADFSLLSDTPAYISNIAQGTHIGVDENGVEAAAYTVIEVDSASAMEPDEQVEMDLNRPFIFAVTSKEGVVLFMGICGDPSAE